MLPRTRGWSCPEHSNGRHDACSPRTRDGPFSGLGVGAVARVLPAHAGWSVLVILVWQLLKCSPRTRGWSSTRTEKRTIPRGLPAHAGMVPGPGKERTVRTFCAGGGPLSWRTADASAGTTLVVTEPCLRPRHMLGHNGTRSLSAVLFDKALRAGSNHDGDNR